MSTRPLTADTTQFSADTTLLTADATQYAIEDSATPTLNARRKKHRGNARDYDYLNNDFPNARAEKIALVDEPNEPAREVVAEAPPLPVSAEDVARAQRSVLHLLRQRPLSGHVSAEDVAPVDELAAARAHREMVEEIRTLMLIERDESESRLILLLAAA